MFGLIRVTYRKQIVYGRCTLTDTFFDFPSGFLMQNHSKLQKKPPGICSKHYHYLNNENFYIFLRHKIYNEIQYRLYNILSIFTH